MKLYAIIISIILILTSITVKAQNYELGKVTVAELEERAHPKDSSAPAAILFKKAKTFFIYDIKNGFTANHVYEFKIKIYKKEGLSWANQKVKYYVGYENMNKDYLEFSNAFTYNIENKNIIKTKLDGQGVFKNNVNKYWNEKTITFPNVKVGSILEFKYILKSENIVNFPDFQCQYEVPVNYFQYKTEIPEFYIYKPLLIGYQNIVTESKMVGGHQNFTNEYNQSRSFNYRQIDAVYSCKDIPALIEEPYVDNLENYRISIRHELERVRLPEQPVKDYAQTWEGVATTIFKNENFGKQLNEKMFLTEDLNRILININSPEERLNIIFKFVQNKMNWDEKNDYYTDKGVKEAYKNQTGNVAEINFILINMLEFAGIKANPVLVSTIENGTPVYPTRTGFNYVIAAAEIDGKQILLDASHKFTSPNILPLNVLNWKGRLIKSDGSSEEINLVPAAQSKENVMMIAKINNLGVLQGKIRNHKLDYDAYRFRIANANKSTGNYLEKLAEQLENAKISNYAVENIKTNVEKPVIEAFDFISENQCEIIGDKMFISPMLFFTTTKNYFNQEKRQMPVYFGYPSQEKLNINLEIPEGYVIETLPKPIQIVAENNVILYKFNINNEGNKIQIICSTEIKSSIFAEDQYDGLKEIFQKIITSQGEKIILKKI
ncbi:DUF3857 domain-containing protein [Flavobacterium flavigenum]|uniref:DUF3857 domain-containing protein n=1 Tax=Flavobacterium flavigenum TaxID=3003258 RepID=UPI002482FA37|nr:DUF3857 domain-containing protein [Flavobacterium flavigenum]